jgi:hypothetical protein
MIQACDRDEARHEFDGVAALYEVQWRGAGINFARRTRDKVMKMVGCPAY